MNHYLNTVIGRIYQQYCKKLQSNYFMCYLLIYQMCYKFRCSKQLWLSRSANQNPSTTFHLSSSLIQWKRSRVRHKPCHSSQKPSWTARGSSSEEVCLLQETWCSQPQPKRQKHQWNQGTPFETSCKTGRKDLFPWWGSRKRVRG